MWWNTGNTQQPGLGTHGSVQTPGSVGLQAVQDNMTTQTKPPGCHQPDIGIVIPHQEQVTGKAILGHTSMNLKIPLSARAGKQGPVSTSLGTRLCGEGSPERAQTSNVTLVTPRTAFAIGFNSQVSISCSFHFKARQPTSVKTVPYLITLSTDFSINLLIIGAYSSSNPLSSWSDERRASPYADIIR